MQNAVAQPMEAVSAVGDTFQYFNFVVLFLSLSVLYFRI